MPKIKSMRDDIIRPDELKLYLKMASRKPIHQYLMVWLYAFGKRISETITLNRDDVGYDDDYIYVRFRVLKTRPKAGLRTIKKKRLTRKHWLAPWLVRHIEECPPGQFLFPSWGVSGHLTRRGALYILKKYDEDIWCHLFRHSLAVMMAEHGGTILGLMAWFDWQDEKTAITYIRTYGEAMEKLSREWGEREF